MFDASSYERQADLQARSFGVEPWNLVGEQRKAYVSNMALALMVEIGEALQEIPWKSWSTKDTFNEAAFLDELIDAGHFLMNLMLIVTDDVTVIHERYFRKANINAERQRLGYDESNKCPTCQRALDG